MPHLALFVALTLILLYPSAAALTGVQDSRPLPDLEALYDRVRENLARAERIEHLYAFKERRTDVHTNLFGKIGTGGTRVLEVYPSATRQLRYRRLIERNGIPLSAQELAEQDLRYRDRVAEVRQELAARTVGEQRRRDDDRARTRSERVDDIVDSLQFKVERRSTYRGVPAVEISFIPKPGAKPTTRYGRTALSFTGTAWVDEASAEVMRVEAKSIDDLSFGFGIVARLGEGTTATMTRVPVDGDVWMPTEVAIRGRGRVALVRRLVIDFVIEWFDYRRLTGDSPTPFLDSRVDGQPGGGPQ